MQCMQISRWPDQFLQNKKRYLSFLLYVEKPESYLFINEIMASKCYSFIEFLIFVGIIRIFLRSHFMRDLWENLPVRLSEVIVISYVLKGRLPHRCFKNLYFTSKIPHNVLFQEQLSRRCCISTFVTRTFKNCCRIFPILSAISDISKAMTNIFWNVTKTWKPD